MKIDTVVSKAFYGEWSSLRGYRSPGVFTKAEDLERASKDFRGLESTWKSVFDFAAVQRTVDQDMERYEERDKTVRERYHRGNLRFLSQNFAQRLFLVSKHGEKLNEDVIMKALEEMKVSGFCPIYPCQQKPVL